ncbi:MAG TPA: nitrite/sulfite reductase [Candidatus Saccharimonadales bacterium]|nr:nitrite/sulfite reductase [Candidatus Saccharimonadales bacterium]
MTEAFKETKAQRIERLKREKNPWERLDEIREFARKGYDSIPPEWMGTYLRSWGVYTQGDGAGVTGGTGGEGKSVPYFMVRIRVPNGLLSSQQVRAVASAAEMYARGVVDITVRQNFQFHWITIEALPNLLELLWKAGLTTTGTCGDVTRNITGCPVAGIDADAVLDASPLARELDRFFLGNGDFYNLPRKFKISLTGCAAWCSYPEINDVGLTGIRRKRRGAAETGFSLRVGGGLSTQPHLGIRLNAFVQQNQVLPVVRTIAEIFRDADVLRQSREQARMKFLFLKHGWNAETFLAEIHKRVGFTLDPAEEEVLPNDLYRDHVGVHAQKQPGKFYVGASVLRGRLSATQLQAVADLSERFAEGEIRTTAMQNLLIANVPERNTGPLVDELGAAGLPVEASTFWRGAVACTGKEFCKLAITETKGFARWVVEELEELVPGFDQQLKLNITGCPNSCGHHWIADLGLEGKKIKVDGNLTDAYYFCVGGSVGKVQAIARPVGYRCLATDVPESIARLLGRYTELRGKNESLQQFFARNSNEDIRGFLAGAASTESAARDLPSGPVPHGIEG